MNRTRYIPSIVMLTAGFVVSIITYVYNYSLKGALLTIAFSMTGFLILGYIIRILVEKLIVQPMLQAMEEEAAAKLEEEEAEDMDATEDNKEITD